MSNGGVEGAWETSITEIKPDEIRLRGYRLDETMGRVGFGRMLFLTVTGRLPGEAEGQLIDAMLVSSIDHGASPPSTLAARTAASTGAPLNAALSAGLLSINRYHGGAVEQCMKHLQAVADKETGDGLALEEAAESVVAESVERKQRLAGFGHRVHTRDPRVKRLFELAEEAGCSGIWVRRAVAVEEKLIARTGKALNLNVDGALGALLKELDFPAELANGFFMVARLPGLLAHVWEEQRTQKPMRRIHPTAHRYVGPAPRKLS